MVVILQKIRFFLIAVVGIAYFYWSKKREAQAFRAGEYKGFPIEEYRNA